MNEISEISTDTANQLHTSVLRLFRLLRDTRSTKGLSLAKLIVLAQLNREGVATATALAAYLRVQPQSLTRQVADLKRRKLITRRPDKADRRQSLLEITEKGIQLLTEELRGQRMKLARTMAEELTSTEQEMIRLASGLLDRLAASIERQTVAGRDPKERLR
jgi:DNA-binding MarR family transcriptional regulator